MKKENRRAILFRYGIVVLVILVVSSLICYNLVDNTVLSADKWNTKAMEELSRVDTIQPVRGNILAADGSILATNMRLYTCRIDFRTSRFDSIGYVTRIDSIADSLAYHFPIRSRDEWHKHLSKPMSKPDSLRPRAFPLIRNISYEEAQFVKSLPFLNGKKKHTGLYVESRLARVRPYGDMARRSIGAVGQSETCRNFHGIYGLEKALDTLLYGKPGISKKVPLTKAIVNWTDVPPRDGYNVRTTIDIKMQDIVENELNLSLIHI